MDKLQKEFEFYQEKKSEFISKYKDKYIVIVGQEVVGIYDDKMEAIDKTKEENSLGTFLVQHVSKGSDEAFFHSRVSLVNYPVTKS